jgi:hypothetical protein
MKPHVQKLYAGKNTSDKKPKREPKDMSKITAERKGTYHLIVQRKKRKAVLMIQI